MTQLYEVRDELNALVMVAPLATLVEVYNLRREAEARIIAETKAEGGFCELSVGNRYVGNRNLIVLRDDWTVRKPF